MKHIFFIVSLFLTLQVAAAGGGSFQEIERKALKELLLENRITQLNYNQKIARLNYQQQQLAVAASRGAVEQYAGPGGTASIEGVVEVDNVGAESVSIYLLDINTRQQIALSTSDQFGAFSFTGLAAGSYYVIASDSLDDYINVMWSNVGSVQCQNCQPNSSNTIDLMDSEVFGPINIDLEIGGSIMGSVAEGSSLLEGVDVLMYEVGSYSYYNYTETDINGSYVIKGIPAGNYYLMIQDPYDVYIDAIWSSTGTEPCSYCEPDVNNTLVLNDQENRNGVDFNLQIGATISGQLIDQDTAVPVETLALQIYDPSDVSFNWYAATDFDGSGNYTVSGVPAGDYRLYLEPSSELNVHIPELYNDIQCNACDILAYDGSGQLISLTNEMTTSNIDFHVEEGSSISGFLVNNNNILETVKQNALIMVFNESNRLLAYHYFFGTNNDPLATGAYTVGGLLPGTYFVQGGDNGQEFYQRELFENIACPWSGCDRGSGGDPVVLGVKEARLGVNFLLNYGGKISGTVTDQSTGLPIPEIDQQFVQFYDSSGEVAGGAYVQTDGTYVSARALPPGLYSVRTGSMFNGELMSPYVMEKFAPGGNLDCPGVTCDLSAGNVNVVAYDPNDPTPEVSATVTGIDFVLSPAFSFSGTITELGSTNPISDVHVLVYDDNAQFAAWSTTDASGDFTVAGLPAGTYYAITNNGSNLPFMGLNQVASGGWIDILFDGRPCPGSACDVTMGDPIVLGAAPVPEGDGKETISGGPVFNFNLDAGGTISGQIRNADNQVPASGVAVNVYNSVGEFYGSYQSDSNGYYMTVGFPVGTYYLTTSNNGALLDIKYGGAYCSDENCQPLDAEPLVISSNQDVISADFDLPPDYIFRSGLE